MKDKIISLLDKREQRDYEQLLLDLQEFIEAKTEAGEPVVVIVERNVSFWERVKRKLGF
jgi:predicted proteasome-type protease